MMQKQKKKNKISGLKNLTHKLAQFFFIQSEPSPTSFFFSIR